MSTIWISPDVLSWHTSNKGWQEQDQRLLRRAHSIWLHADQTLENSLTELQRTDGITALKRALNHRLQLLSKIYLLNQIPIVNKPAGTLQILERLGVIKRVLLNKLLTIRNAIEHDDAAPPSLVDSQELSEFVWYFLRSTDVLVDRLAINFGLKEFDQQFDFFSFEAWGRGVLIETGPHSSWRVEVQGVLAQDLVSKDSRSDWIPIITSSLISREEWLQRNEYGFDTENDAEPHELGDYFFEGKFDGDSDQLMHIYQLYFRVL